MFAGSPMPDRAKVALSRRKRDEAYLVGGWPTSTSRPASTTRTLAPSSGTSSKPAKR
jgi:hypothetical protein